MDNFFKDADVLVDELSYPSVKGVVTGVQELFFEALLPGAKLGTIVTVNDVKGQVVALHENSVKIVPLQSGEFAVGDRVDIEQMQPLAACGNGLLGRIIDPLSVPLDNLGKLTDYHLESNKKAAPNPLLRKRIDEELVTGIKVIDSMLTIGKGQRVGLFAGPGEGKSTLLGDLAQNAACDMSVICMVGERGREAGEFVQDILGEAGLKRSVVVLATGDTTPAMRTMALFTATTISEWFREQGADVLLLVDSLTRVVRAKRDIDLAIGQIAGPSGYPASAFSILPGLLERAGCDEHGSITGIYTVLTQSKKDDPVKNEVQSLLDGHIVLKKKLADAGMWPAVDIPASISRVMKFVTGKHQQQQATVLRTVLAGYDENEDIIFIGAYQKGSSPATDAFLKYRKNIETFLTQSSTVFYKKQSTLAHLDSLVAQLKTILLKS